MGGRGRSFFKRANQPTLFGKIGFDKTENGPFQFFGNQQPFLPNFGKARKRAFPKIWANIDVDRLLRDANELLDAHAEGPLLSPPTIIRLSPTPE